MHRRLHRGFLDRHLIRVPLSQGVLVAAQDRGALPVEEHPIDHGTRKHPETDQVRADHDAQQRDTGLHRHLLQRFRTEQPVRREQGACQI